MLEIDLRSQSKQKLLVLLLDKKLRIVNTGNSDIYIVYILLHYSLYLYFSKSELFIL